MITRSGFTRSITGGHQRTPHKGMSGLAAMGRRGDTMLAHINPEEAELLKEHGGSGAINPRTGLPEFAPAYGNMMQRAGNQPMAKWGMSPSGGTGQLQRQIGRPTVGIAPSAGSYRNMMHRANDIAAPLHGGSYGNMMFRNRMEMGSAPKFSANAHSGFADMRLLAGAGRRGDNMIARINPAQANMLKARGGSGTRNPMTGLPEFWMGEGDTDYGGGPGVSSGGNYGMGDSSGGVGGGQEADIYGEQQAFNNALNAYRDSGSVYTGPAPGLGATVDQRRLEQSQPGWQEKAEAFALGTAMPFGVDARAVKDYMAGKPRIDVTWSPLQGLANMGPLGPLGDIAAPSWGEMTVGSFYPDEGEHAPHAGRGGESGGVDPNVQAQLDALLASVLREPQPDDTRAIAPANPAAAQTYTPFTGNPSTYGQPGGASGHAFFRAS